MIINVWRIHRDGPTPKLAGAKDFHEEATCHADDYDAIEEIIESEFWRARGEYRFTLNDHATPGVFRTYDYTDRVAEYRANQLSDERHNRSLARVGR